MSRIFAAGTALVSLLASTSAFGRVFTPTEDGLYAVFETSAGEFTARLDYLEAPATVANFVLLAEGQSGYYDPASGNVMAAPFYDGLMVDQVDADGVTLGGASERFDTRNLPQILPEIASGLTHDGVGVLSMEVTSGAGTPLGDTPFAHGTQFSISLAADATRDGLNPVFGQVIDGLSVLATIDAATVINSVEILPEGTAANAWVAADHAPRRFELLRIGIDPRANNAEGMALKFLQRRDTTYRVTKGDDFLTYSYYATRDTRSASYDSWTPGVGTVNLGSSVIPASGRAFFRIEERIPTANMNGYQLILTPDSVALSSLVTAVSFNQVEITLDFVSGSTGDIVLLYRIQVIGFDEQNYDNSGLAYYQWYEGENGSVVDLRFYPSNSVNLIKNAGETVGYSPIQPQLVTLQFTTGDSLTGGDGAASFAYFPDDGTWTDAVQTVIPGTFSLTAAPSE